MTKNKKTESFKSSPNLATVFVKIFLDGAKLQLERLLSSQQKLASDPVIAIQSCFHETSNLFEDLATVVQYLELSGFKTQYDQLILDVRNQIRHDVREEFDNTGEKRKKDRARRLGLSPNMQLEMSFDLDEIKIGQKRITSKEISDFINKAKQIMDELDNKMANISRGKK